MKKYGKVILKVFAALIILGAIALIADIKPWEGIGKTDTTVISFCVTDGYATYNGNPQTGNAKVTVTNPTENFSIIYEDTGNETQPTFTNVGTYAVKFRVEATGFETVRGSYSVTIKKATPNYTKPILNTGLSYTGVSQNLIKTASSAGGTYSVGGTTNYISTATAINAGKYKVYWKVAETENYSAYEAYLGEVSIAKANWNVTKTTGGATTSETAGTVTTLNFPNTYTLDTTKAINKGGALQYKLSTGSSWSTAIPTASDEGSYTVNVRVSGDNNHNDYTDSYVAVIESGIKDTIWQNDWAYELTEDTYIWLHAYNGSETTYEVPSSAIVNKKTYTTKIGRWNTNSSAQLATGTITNLSFEDGLVLDNDLNYLFYSCSSLTTLDVSNFNTSNVTNMSSMFYNCSSLTSLDVSKFNTSNVTKMTAMFNSCTKLTSLNVSNFDTSKVTDMGFMFYGCSKLTALDVINFNTSNVTDMYGMFYGCSSLKTIYASSSFVTTNITSSSSMFSNCSNLVGGNGTTYNSSYVDKTYARIDVNGNPGYFTIKGMIDESTSYIGKYADVDGDGQVDGVIFADLAFSGNGTWSCDSWYKENGVYSYSAVSNLKDYTISENKYNGKFGEAEIISVVKGSTGNDRFYIMALEDIGSDAYPWYYSAYNKISDYATITSGDFGTGKQNTANMIAAWNVSKYGEQNGSLSSTILIYKRNDIWNEIQTQANNGWFIPSRAEWAAFNGNLAITSSNYSSKGLSDFYWSSSLYDSLDTYFVFFIFGNIDKYPIEGNSLVRLAKTF